MNVSGSGPVLYVNLVAYTSSVQGGGPDKVYSRELPKRSGVLPTCQLWGDGPENLREMKKWRLGVGPGTGIYVHRSPVR